MDLADYRRRSLPRGLSLTISIHEVRDRIGSMPSRSGDFQVDVHSLVSAAVGVGLHPGWLPISASRTAFDAGWRVELLQAVTDWSTGRVHKTNLYVDELDPTEKGFASYHLGMTFAYAWARVALGVGHLAHVDRLLTAAGYPVTGPRPDLLGASPSGWLYAVEAKGRSGALGSAITSGKRQIAESNYWFSLNGRTAIGVVAATYFAADNAPMKMRIRDPLTTAPLYEISETALRAAALEPYAEVIASQEARLDVGENIGAEIGDTGVAIVISPEAQVTMELLGLRPRPFRSRERHGQPAGFVVAEQEFAPVARPRLDADDLGPPRRLPGVERYETVGRELGRQRDEAEPMTVGPFDGYIDRDGIGILLDERWPRTSGDLEFFDRG